MCNQSELITKVEELKEWQQLLDDAQAMVETLKDVIKQEMDERGVEELEIGTHICRFTTVLTSRLDTKSFKEQYGELYKLLTKQITSRRFTVS